MICLFLVGYTDCFYMLDILHSTPICAREEPAHLKPAMVQKSLSAQPLLQR
ncbi:hypothetical protein PORCAN_1748 [Porphyromonas crevioricanis JCM 13913]|nr:hypothetical protein PORCAN_1748 [Porphyromonas crevioricanis JCM 13913]